MKYTLGGKVFNNQKEIKLYFQNYYRENDVGTILEGEYAAVMTDLIKRHPNYDDTWSNKFTIGLDGWNTKNFQSGERQFSYNKCIVGASPSKNQKKNVQNSARVAIEDQIRAHRSMSRIAGTYQCELCQGMFIKVDVDHNFEIITFQTLLTNYMIEYKCDYDDFQLISTKCGNTFNKTECQRWVAYHAQHAVLRCLCRECHQSRSSSSPSSIGAGLLP
jgi:frataxin-like iron-binding protein CyaY